MELLKQETVKIERLVVVRVKHDLFFASKERLDKATSKEIIELSFPLVVSKLQLLLRS